MSDMFTELIEQATKVLGIDPKRPCTCLNGRPPLLHPYLKNAGGDSLVIYGWCPLHGHGHVLAMKGPHQ